RLLERPECVPECASSPRLRLDVTPGALSARMEVDAATETAVPLPGSARHWSPTRVLVDGQPAQGLWRAPDGVLWLETGGGTPQVDTRVVRVTPPGSAVVLEVPLIPGESVATPDVRVQGGKALISMGPQVSEVSWHSILDQTTSLVLRAPEAVAWTEIWRLDAS